MSLDDEEVTNSLRVLSGRVPATLENTKDIDPVWLGEQLHKASPEDRKAADLTGLGIMQMKSRLMDKLVVEADDTHPTTNSLARVTRIAESLGFVHLKDFPFRYPQEKDSWVSEDQKMSIFVNREKGMVLKTESYFQSELADEEYGPRDRINTGEVYYAWKPNSGEHSFGRYTGSGGWESPSQPDYRRGNGRPTDLVFMGSTDLRSQLRHCVTSLDALGKFLPVWPTRDLPFSMFMNYQDYKEQGDQKGFAGLALTYALSWERYQTMPDWFKEMLNCTQNFVRNNWR